MNYRQPRDLNNSGMTGEFNLTRPHMISTIRTVGTREGMNNAVSSVTEKYRNRGLVIPAWRKIERGGFIGTAEIVDCVSRSDSPWFFGPYGFVLRNAEPIPFHPCRGALGFWRYPLEVDNA